MKKAIYIGNNKLKEVPEMEEPNILNYVSYSNYLFDHSRWNDQLAACKEYSIVGTHSFVEGESYEEGNDYELAVGIKRGDGFVAIPLPKDEGQDECQYTLWQKAVEAFNNYGFDIAKQQFQITRKQNHQL